MLSTIAAFAFPILVIVFVVLCMIGLRALIRRMLRPDIRGLIKLPRGQTYPYTMGVVTGSTVANGIRVSLPVRMPNIIVDSHRNDKDGSSLVFDAFASQRIELEGDFYKDCAVYAPHGLERVALELFTPDVMRIAQSYADVFDLETFGNSLVLLCRRDPRDDPALQRQLVDAATRITDKWQTFMSGWDESAYDQVSLLLAGRAQYMRKLGRRQVPQWLFVALGLLGISLGLVYELTRGYIFHAGRCITIHV